jgi:two-component sensor histidine kinase
MVSNKLRHARAEYTARMASNTGAKATAQRGEQSATPKSAPSKSTHNASQHSRIRRLSAELDAIRQITRSINASSDLRSILDGIVSTVTEVLTADSASIYLLDPARQVLTLKATTGLSAAAVNHGTLAMGEGLTGWAAKHRSAVAVRDAQKDVRFRIVPHTRERSFKSLLAVPLINQDRVIGAMNVQTRLLRRWTAGDSEFATLIADVVAGILDRAVLEEDNERTLREMTAVAAVSKAVIAPVYLDETLRVVADMAARALSARRCAILLLDENTNAYAPRAVYDRKHNAPAEPAWPLRQLPLLNVEALLEPIIIDNVAGELDAGLRRWTEQAELRALICVPLYVRERIIGMINVWAEQETHFTDAQVELCTTLANQIALAIENAHLIGNTAIVQEMHHRVKNNLQNVVMLLQLQLHDDRVVSTQDVLRESISRIQSIAAVHDAMAHDGFRLVNVREVLQNVATLTRSNMVRPDLALNIVVDGDSCRMSSKTATALTLCVNELIANALEHAFVGCNSGEIRATLVDLGGSVEVTVKDNGLGTRAGKMNDKSLGLTIVRTLVLDDLRGSFEIKRSKKGTVARIVAPISYT